MPRTTAAQSQIEPKRGPAPRRVSGLSEDNPDFRLIHERLRLAIVSALAVNSALTFTELREMLAITDGNLSVHARKLEEGGLIVCAKGFVGRMPRSEYKLTARGRKALQRYLDHMDSLIKTVRKAT